MTTVSPRQAQFYEQMAQGADFRYDSLDVAENAFEDTLRAGPTAAIGRAIDSYFDTSTKIDPSSANEQFGLAGTDAAFKEGEEVSIDRAKAVSADFYRARTHAIVKDSVANQGGWTGVTEFAASMAAGFVDPVTLAANIGGGMVIGAAGKGLMASKRAFDTFSKISPTAGRLIESAYAEGVKRSLTAVVAREGLENVIGGVLEESVIRGMDVGEERLAVKTDWTDSMINITAGTILGTAFGTAMSRDGRSAIVNKFGSMFGDDAPARLQTDMKMADIESRAGVERSNIDTELYEMDTYDAKPWHGDANYKADPADQSIPAKVFVSVDADGVAHRPLILGRGTVLHDNPNMAFNKGASVLEIDTANLRIIAPQDVVDAKGRHTELGVKLKDTLANDIVKRVNPEDMTNALTALRNPDADLSKTGKYRSSIIEESSLRAKELADLKTAQVDVPKKYASDIQNTEAKIRDLETKLKSGSKKPKDVAFYTASLEEQRIARQKIDEQIQMDQAGIETQMGETRNLIDTMSRELADIPEPKILNRAQLISEVSTLLDGKSIDEMIKLSHDLGVKSSATFEPTDSINAVIEQDNWNGYMFTNKKANGDVAYRGLYVSEKAQKKLVKSAETPSPVPTEAQLAEYAGLQEKKRLDYAEWMQNKANSLKQTTADAAGMPKQTVDDTITPPKNEIQETLTSSVEKKSALAAVDADLDKRIAAAPDDDTLKALKKLSDDVKAGKDITTMAAELKKQLDEYDVCMLGA